MHACTLHDRHSELSSCTCRRTDAKTWVPPDLALLPNPGLSMESASWRSSIELLARMDIPVFVTAYAMDVALEETRWLQEWVAAKCIFCFPQQTRRHGEHSGPSHIIQAGCRHGVQVTDPPENNVMAVVKDVQAVHAECGSAVPEAYRTVELLARAVPYAPNAVIYSFKGKTL